MADENVKNVRLAEMICAFIEITAIGHERGMYRALSAGMGPLAIVKQANAFNVLFGGATVNYFNLAYKGLILKNDAYIIKCFGEMHSVSGHSYICLLNIVCSGYLKIHRAVDRTKLDVSTLERFQSSVEEQLAPLLAEFSKTLQTTLSHKCDGMDISTCDPNKPMFYATTEEK